tara:strand:+ start:1573 stop:1974 length:402 start_codon:yes stop_codon:yes gene_type:complete
MLWWDMILLEVSSFWRYALRLRSMIANQVLVVASHSSAASHILYRHGVITMPSISWGNVIPSRNFWMKSQIWFEILELDQSLMLLLVVALLSRLLSWFWEACYRKGYDAVSRAAVRSREIIFPLHYVRKMAHR